MWCVEVRQKNFNCKLVTTVEGYIEHSAQLWVDYVVCSLWVYTFQAAHRPMRLDLTYGKIMNDKITDNWKKY